MSSAFLPGAEKYYASAQQKNQRPQTEVEKMIDRANSVSIFDILEGYFSISLPREGHSYKSHCPWAAEHADRGLDKGFRTYPATNSAMCFPMHGFLTPVRLLSIQFGERYASSAERILRDFGMLKPKPWRERYNQLLVEREHSNANQLGNIMHAVEALNVALRQLPSYTHRQFDSDVLTVMEISLESLNQMAANGGGPEELRDWYDKSKRVLHDAVERNEK